MSNYHIYDHAASKKDDEAYPIPPPDPKPIPAPPPQPEPEPA